MNDSDKNQFVDHWNTANPIVFNVLKEKRKEMRDNMTPAEERLWGEIKSKKLGVKFRRQHIIGNYIPDFVALSCKLIIEVDGEIHKYQQEDDEQRTYELNQHGYAVIRFTNDEVIKDIKQVLEKINYHLSLKH